LTESQHFAIVTRDEISSLDRGVVLESRLTHGIAESSGHSIRARDDRDDRLFAECDRECNRVRTQLAKLNEGRARAVVSATSDGVMSTISLSILDLSIVTTPPHLASDYEMLLELSSERPSTEAKYRGVPIVWRNGSGAVLMHEAVGHAEEHGHEAIARVDIPRALRRQSFSDVPLMRMTEVRVAASAPARRDERGRSSPHIEILLVAGGRYEPLTDCVSLSISAANLVDGDKRVRLRPFVIDETRERVAASIRDVGDVVRRYPGVICSKEGQELFVGSFSPDLVTEF